MDTFNLVFHSTHKGGHTLDLHLCSCDAEFSDHISVLFEVPLSCTTVFFKIYVWLFVLFLFVPIPQLNRTLLLAVGASIPSVLIASRHHHRFSHLDLLLLAICTLLLHYVDIEGSWGGLSWHQLLSRKRSLASCHFAPPPFASLGLQAGPVGGLDWWAPLLLRRLG